MGILYVVVVVVTFAMNFALFDFSDQRIIEDDLLILCSKEGASEWNLVCLSVLAASKIYPQ